VIKCDTNDGRRGLAIGETNFRRLKRRQDAFEKEGDKSLEVEF